MKYAKSEATVKENYQECWKAFGNAAPALINTKEPTPYVRQIIDQQAFIEQLKDREQQLLTQLEK